MRRALKISLLAILVITAGFVSAQAQKLAHIDSQALVTIMPEYAAAQKVMDKEAKNMEDLMGTMQTEYQTKLTDFSQKADSLSEIVKQAKVEELQNLEQRIRSFQQTAQQKLQQKNAELMQPILKKANEAIDAVSKEQGITYVFDTNALLFKSASSVDLLPLVKTKLGIQ